MQFRIVGLTAEKYTTSFPSFRWLHPQLPLTLTITTVHFLPGVLCTIVSTRTRNGPFLQRKATCPYSPAVNGQARGEQQEKATPRSADSTPNSANSAMQRTIQLPFLSSVHQPHLH